MFFVFTLQDFLLVSPPFLSLVKTKSHSLRTYDKGSFIIKTKTILIKFKKIYKIAFK